MAPGANGVRRPRATRFVDTRRWLRGRIVNGLRETPEGTWVKFDEPIGGHGVVAVREALIGLERDGFLELDGDRARLR